MKDATRVTHMWETHGGPAFPSTLDAGDGSSASFKGMSLREWYAGQALAGLTANSIPGSHHVPSEVVRAAFEIADLMLAASLPPPPKGGEK